MKKYNNNFAPKIMSFYTIMKKNAMRSLLQKSGTRQTIQKNSVGFSPWENTEIPWDVLVLFFSAPLYFSQLCQFSSDFDVSYHFGIRRQN